MLVAAVGAGCSGSDEEPVLTEETLPAASSVPPSTGEVTIGDRTYAFEGTCYDVGAGDVVVVGAGADVDGAAFDVLVQAFYGEPYVTVALADGTRIEPALDAPIDLFFDADRVQGTGIRFVTGLEPGVSAGEPLGEGTVSVSCGGYVRGMPPGYDGVVAGEPGS